MIRVSLTGTVLLYKQSEDMFDLFKKKAMQCKNIQAEDFKAIIDENPDGVVLDVRTRGAVKQGKIPGATAIDIMHSQVLEKIEQLD